MDDNSYWSYEVVLISNVGSMSFISESEHAHSRLLDHDKKLIKITGSRKVCSFIISL